MKRHSSQQLFFKGSPWHRGTLRLDDFVPLLRAFYFYQVCVSQLCLTLFNSLGCLPPGSPVHGFLQARILEWVAILFSRGSSQPRDQTQVSHCRQILYCLSHLGRLSLKCISEWSFFPAYFLGARVRNLLLYFASPSLSVHSSTQLRRRGGAVRRLAPGPGRPCNRPGSCGPVLNAFSVNWDNKNYYSSPRIKWV